MGKIRIPTHYFLCRTVYTDSKHAAWSTLRPLLMTLTTYYTTKYVEIGASYIDGSAWESSLPWRKSQYGYNLSLATELLRDPQIWEQILAHTKGSPSWIQTFRGGGATRHLLWSVDRRFGNDVSDDLHLCAAHTWDDSHERKARDLFRAFFHNTVNDATVFGDGRLVQVCGRASSSWDVVWTHSFADAFADHLYYTAKHDGQLGVPGLQAANVFGRAILERLGGYKALRARFDKAFADMSQAESGKARGYDYNMPPPEQCGSGVLAAISVGDPDISEYQADFIRCNGSERMLWWLMDELIAAGLYLPARQGMIAAEVQRQALYRAEAAASGLRKNQQINSATVARTSEAIEAHRERVHSVSPRCLRQGTKAKDCPKKFPPNLAVWRVGDALHKVHPVYGVAVKGTPGLLGSPICVGALQPGRAALHFDITIHGWDGEQTKSPPAKRRLTQLVCCECQGRLFEAWAGFEQDDTPDDLPVDSPDECDNPQDYFTWFTLVTRCASCGAVKIAADEECA